MADDRVGRLEERVKALEIHHAKRNERDTTVIKVGAAALVLIGTFSTVALAVKSVFFGK